MFWSKFLLIFNSVGLCWRPRFWWSETSPSPLPSGSTKEPPSKSRFCSLQRFKWILFGESYKSHTRVPSSVSYWKLHSGSPIWAQTSSPHWKAFKTPSARRARHPLGRPSRMFPWLIFTRSRKRNKSRSSYLTGWSSRCLHMELVTTRNISSMSLSSCVWLKQKGTAAKVKEAFAAFVAVRKELSPLLEFPDDEIATE